MPDDVDVLAVLADVVGTPDPIGLLQALEEKGLVIQAAGVAYSPDEHMAAMREFMVSLEPTWVSSKEVRERLVRDGWSEEMAEHLASHIAHLWINQMEASLMADIEVETHERIAAIGQEQDA